MSEKQVETHKQKKDWFTRFVNDRIVYGDGKILVVYLYEEYLDYCKLYGNKTPYTGPAFKNNISKVKMVKRINGKTYVCEIDKVQIIDIPDAMPKVELHLQPDDQFYSAYVGLQKIKSGTANDVTSAINGNRKKIEKRLASMEKAGLIKREIFDKTVGYIYSIRERPKLGYPHENIYYILKKYGEMERAKLWNYMNNSRYDIKEGIRLLVAGGLVERVSQRVVKVIENPQKTKYKIPYNIVLQETRPESDNVGQQFAFIMNDDEYRTSSKTFSKNMHEAKIYELEKALEILKTRRHLSVKIIKITEVKTVFYDDF